MLTFKHSRCIIPEKLNCRLLRREALLRGSETYYDAQDNRSSSFISDYSKAMQRNDRLRDVRPLQRYFYTHIVLYFL